MNFFSAIVSALSDLWHYVCAEALAMGSFRSFWSELREFALLYPATICIGLSIFAFIYALLRESRLRLDKGFSPSLSIIVPACDEELVIARTIIKLANVDYPNLKIHIVSDGSVDRTVEIARRFENDRLLVHELADQRGKSGALQYALDLVDTELYMVVDADTEVAPDAIRKMVQQFKDPQVAAVTGSARVANITNLLSAIQAVEYVGIIGMVKRAQGLWGALFTVCGAAACFRTSVLRDVGGWTCCTVTEDIELSWRLQKAGYRIAYEPRAVFRVQAPVSYVPLFRQRMRWARGTIEVLRLHGNLAATRNTTMVPVLMEVLLSILWILLVVATLAHSVVLVLTGQALFVGTAPMDFAIILGWTTALLAVQTLIGCVLDSYYVPRTWFLIPLSLLYPLYYWLVILPSCLCGWCVGIGSRAGAKWKRTTRTPIETTDASCLTRK